MATTTSGPAPQVAQEQSFANGLELPVETGAGNIVLKAAPKVVAKKQKPDSTLLVRDRYINYAGRPHDDPRAQRKGRWRFFECDAEGVDPDQIQHKLSFLWQLALAKTSNVKEAKKVFRISLGEKKENVEKEVDQGIDTDVNQVIQARHQTEKQINEEEDKRLSELNMMHQHPSMMNFYSSLDFLEWEKSGTA